MSIQRGLVLKKSGDKTYKVLIKYKVIHKKYKKILTKCKKILMHDEFNFCRVGFNVLIRTSKPISSLKH